MLKAITSEGRKLEDIRVAKSRKLEVSEGVLLEEALKASLGEDGERENREMREIENALKNSLVDKGGREDTGEEESEVKRVLEESKKEYEDIIEQEIRAWEIIERDIRERERRDNEGGKVEDGEDDEDDEDIKIALNESLKYLQKEGGGVKGGEELTDEDEVLREAIERSLISKEEGRGNMEEEEDMIKRAIEESLRAQGEEGVYW
jgi:hypothetical protein